VLCPSHCGIPGNERADTLAKQGAHQHTPCRYAVTTKAWLQAQARTQFLQRWKTELPLARPSFKFPDHLHGTKWADTRALYRVFTNRSPSDPHPNQTSDPCPCGQDLNSSHHHLRDCILLAPQRALLQQSTKGDIQSLEYLTEPANAAPLRRFLRTTGLGHTKNLRYNQTPTEINSSDPECPSSPEPDFAAFEP
jgi:hypothetical protein